MNAVLDNLDLVAKAFGYTVFLFLVSAVLSFALGTLLVTLRVGPVAVLNKVAAVYVTVIRNTPLLIMFMFMQFAAPKLGIRFNFVDIHLGPFDFTSFFSAAVVSLSLYTSCFVAESLRSGVNAVELGQAEAARAVGLPFAGVMTNVVLPQAIRASVPPLASTLIALLKNTSVASVFGVIEAAAQMDSLTNDFTTQRWGIFLTFAFIYVALVELVSIAATLLERRWRVA